MTPRSAEVKACIGTALSTTSASCRNSLEGGSTTRRTFTRMCTLLCRMHSTMMLRASTSPHRPDRGERWAQLADEFPHHVVSDVLCAQGRQSLDGVEETRAVIKVQPGCVAYPARSFYMVTCHLRRLAHPSRDPRTGHVRDDNAIPQLASTMHDTPSLLADYDAVSHVTTPYIHRARRPLQPLLIDRSSTPTESHNLRSFILGFAVDLSRGWGEGKRVRAPFTRRDHDILACSHPRLSGVHADGGQCAS